MISPSKDNFLELKKILLKEKKTLEEIRLLTENQKNAKENEKNVISNQIKSLKTALKITNENLLPILENISLVRPLQNVQGSLEKISSANDFPIKKIKKSSSIKSILQDIGISDNKGFVGLEKEAIKRFGKQERVKKNIKERKAGWYIKKSTKLFGDISERLAQKEFFGGLKRNLAKSNMQFVPKTYISIVLFTTLLSVIGAFFIFLFFLFFSIGLEFPIIFLSKESILSRLPKVFGLLFVIPLITFISVYSYPSLEKKANESKINGELPFATIHMSAISGSLIDPTKIFSIIISTGEYPNISREFTKLLNQINLFGNDLVSSLRELSFNTASSKFSELLNGLSTTISSGGDLSEFFEKRAESLLFEYKIEREKSNKAAETFMDIYISVVIASPMILMLLLMMMKISGIGISLSSSMISLIMVLGVTMINIGFLTFLHLNQPSK
ncbi:MAG: type II secretion system F family protein [Nanoarchaeota archaeon]|nr:type II secretion system F family protein [Nanoarchaeota archaeon]